MKVTILSVCVLAFIYFSTQTFAVDFGVNFTSDQHDEDLADGFCDIFTGVAGAQCTLRAAVEQANALASNDRILFLLPNNSTVTLTTANGGEIPVTNNGTLEIIGMGANNLTINGGAGTNRIFYTNEANVLITGMTLTGGGSTGTSSGRGGAIYANKGSLTLERVHVKANSATEIAGGVFFSGGTHQITGSTVSANTGSLCGGIENAGTLTILNSTISGNSETQGSASGGGFCSSFASANTTMRNVTITNNSAFNGGGIDMIGSLNFGNTIVAGNIATGGSVPEINISNNASVTSAGGNLVGDSPGDSTNTGNSDIAYQASDKQNVNPLFGPLQDNGGPTPTHSLLAGSPAIDAGLNFLANGAGLTTDQRGTGFERIRDGNGNGTATVDIGAFEVQTAPLAVVNFTVNVTSDEHDPNLADGLCSDVSPAPGIQCSLRAAIEQANALAGNSRILFDLPANSTITLTAANGGEIPIIDNGSLLIVGTGANNLTIDGGTRTNRIFFINEATVIISGVTLTGGNGTGSGPDGGTAPNGLGGAIFTDEGSLTLDGVHVTGNSTPDGIGGGVLFFGGTHRISNSTFSANTALNCGGFDNEDSTLTVVNSTISGNTATDPIGLGGVGGGFCSIGSASATLRNVTIANNKAIAGGGIIQSAGVSQNTLNFGNTIIAGNIANSAPEIRFVTGTIISAGYNLVGDEPGDSNNPGIPIPYELTDILDKPPLLGALQNNGGPTPTRALLTKSPAIDGGLNALATGAGLTTDQRATGFSRFRDGNGDNLAFVDIGAVEVETIVTTAATVSVSGHVTTASGRGITGISISLTDSDGNVRTTVSTSLGEYRFDDVEVGATYILTATGKRYAFSQPSQVLNVNEETSGVNFIGNSTRSLREIRQVF